MRHRCTLYCRFESLYRAAAVIEWTEMRIAYFACGSGFGISKYLIGFLR